MSMASGAHSNKWREREVRRADGLHKIFTRIEGMGLTYPLMFRQARRLGGASFLKSFKTFERLFLKWRTNPRPETLRRNWKPGMRESSTELVSAVVMFASAARITLREAHGKLGLPVSYSTVFRHCSEEVRLAVARRAAIRSAQARAAGEENSLLLKITEGKAR